MKFEINMNKVMSVLVMYELYMYSIKKSWKFGLAYKVISNKDVKAMMNKITGK